MKKAFLGALLLVALFTSAAWGQQYTARLGHTGGDPTNLYYAGAEEFKRLVEERSQGRLLIEVYPASQLGSDRDLQESARLGHIEMGLSSTPVVLLDGIFGVLDLPYLFRDRDHVSRVLDGPIGKGLAARLEKQGLKHLGFWENGFRHITNNIRPIYQPGDLKGIKLRTPESPVRLATFTAFGASPTPMSWGEVFGALQQGVIDGQENPLGHIYSHAIYEVNRYLSISSHIYAPVHLLCNKRFFDSLPGDLQEIVSAAGRDVAAYTRNLGAEFDSKYVDLLKEKGMEVNQVDMDAFIQASRPIWDDFLAKNDPTGEYAALLNEILK